MRAESCSICARDSVAWVDDCASTYDFFEKWFVNYEVLYFIYIDTWARRWASACALVCSRSSVVDNIEIVPALIVEVILFNFSFSASISIYLWFECRELIDEFGIQRSNVRSLIICRWWRKTRQTQKQKQSKNERRIRTSSDRSALNWSTRRASSAIVCSSFDCSALNCAFTKKFFRRFCERYIVLDLRSGECGSDGSCSLDLVDLAQRNSIRLSKFFGFFQVRFDSITQRHKITSSAVVARDCSVRNCSTSFDASSRAALSDNDSSLSADLVASSSSCNVACAS